MQIKPPKYAAVWRHPVFNIPQPHTGPAGQLSRGHTKYTGKHQRYKKACSTGMLISP